MKRPILWTSLGILAGTLFWEYQLPLAVPAGLILCSFILMFPAGRRLPVSFLAGILLSLFSGFFWHQSDAEITEKVYNCTCFEGVVKTVEKNGFRLRIIRYGDERESFRTSPFYVRYLHVLTDDIPEEGSRVLVFAEPSAFQDPENPGAFDAEEYYRSLGCIAEANAIRSTVTRKPGIVARVMKRIRNHLSERLNDIYPKSTVGLPAALLLGDRAEMSEDSRELYERFGLAHVLAVSGLHVSFFAELLTALFYRILSKQKAEWLTVTCLFGYGFLCRFPVSCVRAVFTYCLSITAGQTHKTYDSLTANAFLLSLLLFLSPFRIRNLSFRLSFAAGFLVPMTGRKELKGKAERIFFGSLILYFGLLPVQINAFFTFSPIGILVNVLLLMILEGIFVLSFGSLFISLFFLPLGIFVAGPVHYFLLGFEALLSGLNKASFLTVALGHQSAFRLCAYGILFALILMLSHLKNRHFILLMLALWLVLLPDRSRTVIANLSVGQGDCGVILSKENVIVIDCGSLSRKEVGKKVLKPFLLYYGYREADYVILSHTDSDHVNGIANCGDVFGSAREIFVSPNYKDAPEVLAPAVKEDRIRYVRSGDSLTVGGIDIRFLTYPIKGDDVNDGCLLAEVKTEGFCFWFLGDISEAVLTKLTKDVSGSVYAVKVPHHGSRFSLAEAFYDAVKPETAVISVGRNTYGHPAEEVLTKLKEIGAEVYVTKECGAVLTYIRHGKIYTESFLQE